MDEGDKYVFLMAFGGMSEFVLGLPFLKKNQIVFKQDSKTLGFYLDKSGGDESDTDDPSDSDEKSSTDDKSDTDGQSGTDDKDDKKEQGNNDFIKYLIIILVLSVFSISIIIIIIW